MMRLDVKHAVNCMVSKCMKVFGFKASSSVYVKKCTYGIGLKAKQGFY